MYLLCSCYFAVCSLTQIKQVIPEKEKEVLEQITWNLDKQENETLPQVSLNSLEVSRCVQGRGHQLTLSPSLFLTHSSSLTMSSSWCLKCSICKCATSVNGPFKSASCPLQTRKTPFASTGCPSSPLQRSSFLVSFWAKKERERNKE